MHHNPIHLTLRLVSRQSHCASIVDLPLHLVVLVTLLPGFVEVRHILSLVKIIPKLALKVFQRELIGFLDGGKLANDFLRVGRRSK